MWLWEGHVVPLTRLEPCLVKGERASNLHSASGSEAVLTCRFSQVPLQFPSTPSLLEAVRLCCPEHWLSAASLWGDCNGQVSLYILVVSRTPSSFRKRHDLEKYFEVQGPEKMQWLKTNGEGIAFLLRVSAWSQARHTAAAVVFFLYFHFCDYFF